MHEFTTLLTYIYISWVSMKSQRLTYLDLFISFELGFGGIVTNPISIDLMQKKIYSIGHMQCQIHHNKWKNHGQTIFFSIFYFLYELSQNWIIKIIKYMRMKVGWGTWPHTTSWWIINTGLGLYLYDFWLFLVFGWQILYF